MFKLTFIFLIPILISGCAIYHRDPSTGAEHIWGFGHLATKVMHPVDGKQTVITRATLAGIGINFADSIFGISAGWDCRERIIVYDENTSIAIARPPSNDFFHFRIGSYPPDLRTDNNKP